MINDATNSVYRMVQGAVTDFFRQTVLDFTYGYVGLNGLERYYDDLISRDPSESIRLARVRASAIESCRREVVPESEVVLGGWTLCSPLQANAIQALKLEEKVALVTPKALYVCSYDFGSEKLNEFTKVLVGDIVGIQEGKSRSLPVFGDASVGVRLTVSWSADLHCAIARRYTGLYVTSPHDASHAEDNWGFVVTYLNATSRSNTTASIKNVTTTNDAASSATSAHTSEASKRIFAFRAISDEIDDPTTLSNAGAIQRSRHLHHTIKGASSTSQRGNTASSSSKNEAEAEEQDEDESCLTSKKKVQQIVELLRECCIDAGAYDPDDEEAQTDKPFITHKTIQRYVLLRILTAFTCLSLELSADFLIGVCILHCLRSLDEAKAMMPLFGSLIEGLKRRLWL